MKGLGKVIIGKVAKTSSDKLGDVIIVPSTENKSIVLPLDKPIVTGEEENTIQIIPSGKITTNKIEGKELLNNLGNTTTSNEIPNTEISIGGNNSKSYNFGIDDHGKLKGLKDDDHPQYLQKTQAEQMYQPMIYIGTTPPQNPYINQIWIDIS